MNLTKLRLSALLGIVKNLGVGVLCLGMFLVQITTWGATVSVFPSADTEITAGATTPLGSRSTFRAGTRRLGQVGRGLLRFELPNIPPTATITSVAVELSVALPLPSGSPANSNFRLHRLLRDWDELEATWAEPDFLSNWATPGGEAGTDFASAPSASVFISGANRYTFASTPELIADVEAWRSNPSSNFGWILMTESEGVNQTARNFVSREGLTAGSRPSLVIGYSTGAPQPQLTQVQLAAGQFEFRFNSSPGETYRVESRTNVATGEWTTVTNVPPGPAQAVVIRDALAGQQKFYRVLVP